jgi:cadmium resistance transport/sequestration family protein
MLWDLWLVADVALAIALFVATNIDDLFILLAVFTDPRFRARHVVLGQIIGMGALVLISVIAALISLVVATVYIGLLGLIPIAIGLEQLWDRRVGQKDDDEALESRRKGRARGQVLSVAAITIANGGDNIGAYTPVFAVASSTRTMVIVAVFALMTVLWCAFAHWLVNHPTIGAVIRRYGRRVLPFVLIGLGIAILLEAGTIHHFLLR